MPISDEIIELEPVKKSKSKVVVFIVIAAVMFALAATFLVLFLVKPGGGGSAALGKVNDVTVNASALFAGGGSDDKVYASVGTEYTIYASASVDGDVSSDIKWSFSPYNALIDAVSGEDENGKYYRFKPNIALADGKTKVTVTVASASDGSVSKNIEFYIVKQGTEHIEFLRYNRGTNASASSATIISGAEIDVPCYVKNNNNEKFIVTLEQHGAYSSSTETYSPLTLSDGFCNFDVTSSDPSVIDVQKSDIVQKTATDSPKFAFRVLKTSSKPVTLTVTANSAVATLTVNIKSNSEMGYIEKIYIADRPIGTGADAIAFYKKLVAAGDSADWHNVPNLGINWLSDTQKNNVLTLPYSATYTHILSHVVISPLSLQYDAEEEEILSAWRGMINVSLDPSSRVKDPVTVSRGAITCNTSLTNGLDCVLAFTDNTRNAISSSAATMKLNVVAQNNTGTVAVSLGANNNYSSTQIEELNSKGEGIAISTGNEATMTVTYPFIAPASTDPDKMVSSGYVSTGFRITTEYLGSESGDNPGLSVKVGTTSIDPVKDYSFSTSLVVTHGAGQQFTGSAPVKISVNPGALKGKYRLTFEKIGTSVEGDNTFNNLNAGWSRTVSFDVTPLATEARLKTVAESAGILESNKVGNFVPNDNVADLYVQNRDRSTSSWSVTDFIYVNGAADYNVTAGTSSSPAINNSLTSDHKLQFLGTKPAINSAGRDLRINIIVYPQGSKNVLAELTIYIHVVDAVTALNCTAATTETITYGGTSDTWKTIPKESIKPTYEYSGSPGNQTYDTTNFALGYARNINDEYSFEAFDTVELEDGIGYKLSGRPDDEILFKFSGRNFTQAVDLFEYSIKNSVNINLSHIMVRYYLNDLDRAGGYYLNDPDGIYAQKTYVFSRNADEIGIYTDSACTEKLTQSSYEYSKTINTGVRQHFYASAIIELSDGSKIVVDSDPKYRAIAHEDVYIRVHSAFTEVSGTRLGTTGNNYYDFEANVPTVNLGEDDKVFTMSVFGCDGRYSLKLTVQNKAKPISALSVYSAGTETQLTKLEFVNSNKAVNDDWHTKSFTVKVSYAAGSGTYNYYEPFTLSVPDCFDVYYDGKKLNNLTIQPEGEPNAAAMSQSFDFTLVLKNTAAAMSNGTVYAVGTASASNKSNEASVTVGVGLSDIKFKVNGVDYSAAAADTAPVGIKFASKSGTDSQTVRVPLEFVTLGGEDHTNVAYDFTKLSVDKTIEEINGVRTLIVTIPANTANGKQTVTATFTDTAFGANKTFTVKLEITVTHDVFAIAQNTYNVQTSGGDGLTAYVPVAVTYNNSEANYAPELDSSKLAVMLVLRSGNSGAYTYSDYNVNDAVKNTDGNWTFAVPDSLTSGQIGEGDNKKQLCVRVSYGALVSYAEVHITTSAVGVGYAEGITVANNAASVNITSATENSFKLAARAYNLGTDSTIQNAMIAYKLYSDPARSNEVTSGISINNNGVITFTDPPAYSGKVYYRASYNGVNYDVNISYTVDIGDIELFGLDGVLSDGTITLYRVDGSHYTALDLFGHIRAKSVLSAMTAVPDVTFTATAGTAALNVNTLTLSPASTGNVTLTISTSYNDKTVSKQYNVKIVGLTFEFANNNNTGTIDVIDDDGSISFSTSVGGGLSGTLDLAYDAAKLNVAAVGNDHTVTLVRSAFTAAGDYKNYDITATYTFALDGTVFDVVGGALTVSKTFTLTVENGYTFGGFELKDGADTIVTSDSSVGKVTVAQGSVYTIAVPYVAGFVTSAATSSRTDIATVSVNNGSVAVEPTHEAFGEVTIEVTVTAYGKTFTRSQKYNFADEIGVTASMAGVTNGQTIALDYTTTAPTFTYSLTVANATVAADNVHFTWSGDVAASETKTAKTVTFTVSKPTTLTVIGYIEVDGRRYYGQEYKVTFTATAPVFALTVDNSEITPMENATFGISQSVSNFQGNYSVSYAFVGTVGADVATLNNNVLTPNPNRTDDKAVVVRATVTVNNGAYSGTKYVLEKSITINGVPLPTITANVSSARIAVGETLDLNGCFDITNKADLSSIEFVITPSTINHALTTDGKLTVSDMNAGGKFTVKATSAVKTGVANAGTAIESGEIVVYVTPSAAAATKTIDEGRIGAYDIKNAVTIASDTKDGAFKANDTYTVAFAYSGASVDGITVDGSTVTLANTVTGSDVTLNLTATVTITSGEHAGATISVNNVTVTVKAVPQYTVTFDSGVQSQTVLKGDKATRPDDPTQVGKTFAGWKVSGAQSNYDFNTPVTSDVTLTAQWETNSYTVAFDSMGGTDVAEATVAHGGNVVSPTDPTKDGYDFGGWYTDAACTGAYSFGDEVTSSFTLYAKWNAKSYTVTFDSDGGSAVQNATVKYNDKIVKPADPTKIGYTFAGWNNGNTAYDFATAVTGDVTLTAQWTKNSYTVIFDANGGTSVANASVEHGDKVQKPTDDPTKTGYTFDGWYLNGTAYNFTTATVTGDITLVARWTADTFTVTFYDDNGTTKLGEQTVAYNGKAVEPKDPTKTGCTFVEWQSDGVKYEFTTAVTSNVELVAKWNVNMYTVTFVTNCDTSIESASVAYGGKVEAPADPTKEGYTFDGWYLNGAEYDFDTEITSDITLVAQWTEIKYTVTFMVGEKIYATQTVLYGEKVIEPIDPDAAEGMSFSGWFVNDTDEIGYQFPNEPLTDHLTLTARFAELVYNVVFDPNGGTPIGQCKRVLYGEKADPIEVTREGYTLEGWYEEFATEKFDFNKEIKKHTYLIARWVVATYTVTFNDDSDDPTTKTVAYNNTVARPTDPTKEGYTFDGWFEKDGETGEFKDTAFDFSQGVTSDVTLFAKWTENEPVTGGDDVEQNP